MAIITKQLGVTLAVQRFHFVCVEISSVIHTAPQAIAFTQRVECLCVYDVHTGQ